MNVAFTIDLALEDRTRRHTHVRKYEAATAAAVVYCTSISIKPSEISIWYHIFIFNSKRHLCL